MIPEKASFQLSLQVTRHNNYLQGDLLNILRMHYSQNTSGRLFLTLGKLMI